jgi:hypothetical protein
VSAEAMLLFQLGVQQVNAEKDDSKRL